MLLRKKFLTSHTLQKVCDMPWCHKGGGGGLWAEGAITPYDFPSSFFACQLRGQSCTLMMIIPLPHYKHLASIGPPPPSSPIYSFWILSYEKFTSFQSTMVHISLKYCNRVMNTILKGKFPQAKIIKFNHKYTCTIFLALTYPSIKSRGKMYFQEKWNFKICIQFH